MTSSWIRFRGCLAEGAAAPSGSDLAILESPPHEEMPPAEAGPVRRSRRWIYKLCRERNHPFGIVCQAQAQTRLALTTSRFHPHGRSVLKLTSPDRRGNICFVVL